MEEQKLEKIKLIFGLGPFATMINSLLLLCISSLLNAIYFCVHCSTNTVDFTKTDLNNPWYITLPLFALSWFMFIKYIEWRYILPKGFSIKGFGYQIFFLASFVVFESVLKLILIHKLISIL